MSDIFISYSSKDRARAKVLAGALERQGWSVWWDRRIPPGKQFSQVIKEAMDEAKCVIVLWSKESVKSEWVQNEAAEGARRKILVPAFIDDVEIPFEFRRIQAARLVDWEGRSPHPEFDTLLEALCAILGQPLLPLASEPIPDEQQPVNEIHTLPKDKPKDDRPMDTTISKEPKKLQTTKVLAGICIVTLIAIVSLGVFLKHRQRTGPQRRGDITPVDKTPATTEKPEPPTEVEPIQPEEGRDSQLGDVSRRAPISDGLYVITSVSSNKSLDIDGLMPEDGANVIQCNYSGNPTQQWSLQHVGRGYYRIMAGNSETICLEVVEGGTNVQLNEWQDTDNDNQKWALESAGEDCYKIIAGHSGKCLDIDGSSGSAIQNTGSDSDSQKWIVQPTDSYPAILPTRGTNEEHFIIFGKKYAPHCLVVADNKAKIMEWMGYDDQRWWLVPVGDGYFRIFTKDSGDCLTVKDNSVLRQPYVGDESQKWRVKKHEPIEESEPNDFYYEPGDFYYEIENRQSGMCLTVDESRTTDVVQKSYIGSEDQKWQLKPAEQSWMENIAVTIRNERPSGKGWQKRDVNLNEGCWLSPPIWLWVRGPARDNITVTSGKDADPKGPGEGWRQIETDLNDGSRGKYIYLWVRGPTRDNITVTSGKDTKRKGYKGKCWKQIGPDLNEGAWGKYLYLWVR